MMDAVPVTQPFIIVEEVSSHQPALFLGFMAVGPDDAMAKLEKRAANLKFPTSRPKNDRDQTEVMILFPPGTDHRAGLQLYRDALAGQFGNFQLEVVIIPKRAASDGVDLDKDPSIGPPSSIAVPSS